jgi:hypothetical protein
MVQALLINVNIRTKRFTWTLLLVCPANVDNIGGWEGDAIGIG